MPDASELIRAIKKAALDAVNERKPADLCFGTVTNTAPLQILVEQKLTLGAEQLVLILEYFLPSFLSLFLFFLSLTN